ncbi:hypothetical protein DDB_G0290953 [Dictyostelium discoideum AX4]|uniref:Uncharacterized protein n=1 Tax=Dictyostelium discoideum TaxID=44689 RepID=Q54FC7_DICDI|nr:hypothetical protein DDB_G0290953 [Dictyostelium discoideum AX4]EAL61992.1 hypothetical protein DDB_G0290953 [Dictyostelium discoideum AX4]|eukprot:XP_635495.1 hypothetical protein DDB_G0290953 [Dictyostelium discoideum AX4]
MAAEINMVILAWDLYVEFNQSDEFGVLFNEVTIDKNDLKYKVNVEFREAETSKNKLQRDIEITKRKSTDDLVEKAIEHSTTEVRSTHEAATTSNNGGITTQSNKNKTGKKRANQLQSDADFTKRFSNETSSVSNKRESRRVNN